MKKFFILCLMAFVMCVNANAQERVNGVKYSFNKHSELVQHATLWTYNNDTEQWKDKKDKNTAIGIKTFVYENTLYYVLYLQYARGGYKYPNIREGYHSWLEECFAILSEEEYNTIKNVNGYYRFEFYSYSWLKGHCNDDNEVIRKLLNNYNRQSSTDVIGFAVQNYNDVVRFNYSISLGWKYCGEKSTLKTDYYEVSKTEWNKLTLN